MRKLRPELIAQAQDQTAATITRIMLTFVGVAIFCLLSLLTPDAALLTGGERLNVPFAGPVSFLGFIFVGPAILIVLRIYLQIYVEHYRRLEPIRRRLGALSVPTVAPLQNPLLRIFVEFVLYLLLPLTMLAFTWKAAVLPVWGTSLVGPTVAVIAGHLLLPVRWSWWEGVLPAAGVAAMCAATVVSLEGPLRRPAHLFRADLSNQWLPDSDLQGANLQNASLQFANLTRANLTEANLVGADLASADLFDANLERADLTLADLAGANLTEANLEGANLGHADLEGADLFGADLRHADIRDANLERADLMLADLAGANLTEANLEGAILRRANLKGSDLTAANLKGADFSRVSPGMPLWFAGADLEGANFAGANLEDAILEGAILTNAKRLTQAQLDQACGDEVTQLPKNLSVSPCDQ